MASQQLSEYISKLTSTTTPEVRWAIFALGLVLVLVACLRQSKETTIPDCVNLKIEALYHYPIKGFSGCELNIGKIGSHGFEDDRTFCLQKVHRDPETGDVKQYETMYSSFHLQMALFKQVIEDGPEGKVLTITRTGPENPKPKQLTWTGSDYQIRIPLRPDVKGMKKLHLDLHGSATDTYDVGDTVSLWLTKYIGFETRLVYIGQHSRVVLGSGAPNGDMAYAKRSPFTAPIRRLLPSVLKAPTERITFQDIGQYLVITKESNDEVSSRLADGMEMDITKFRPNIIVSGAPKAYDEDYWAEMVLPSGIKMKFGGTCWRCQAITVDYKTGKKAEDDSGMVWKKLAEDRRVDRGWKYGPVFGKYCYTSLADNGKTIRVGDTAKLTKRTKERPVFDWPLPKSVISAFK
ncbi:mosc domain-containing protein [Stagonosporopsis vannaccii]|nr:mosc domain-containing protein [Stagonosporopsis vannaccii]